MANTPPAPFDAAHAEKYDKSFEKLASFKEALNILTSASLTDLPDDARVLCVGAGTGVELLHLASCHPGWSFTAVDLSAPMLDVCKRRAAEAGIAGRCAFHVGPVDTLADPLPFHAATSLLVSQFILDAQDRVAYFQAIRARLRDGGRLVTADLAGDLDAPDAAGLVDTWRGALMFNGASREDLDRAFAANRRTVSIIPEDALTSLIRAAGFFNPTRIFQAGMIHGWRADR